MSNKQQVGKPTQKIETRVAPIKPADSAKKAIYGGQDEAYKTQARISKRNEGTLLLGDGYNYFKDQNNNRR